MRLIESTRNRSFSVGLPTAVLEQVQAATLATRYKGRRFCKNPFDIVLYLKLLEKLRPATIVEIGTSEGGSAIWFRDQCASIGLETEIHSFDLALPEPVDDPKIHFAKGDAYHPEDTLPLGLLRSLPHPWLVIDDSAHTHKAVAAVLKYFDDLVQPGDYVVVEDGVVADLPGPHYATFEDGPNRAVAEFLDHAGPRYEIDTDLCDFFGHNVTYCPNAWLTVTDAV